MEMMSINQVRCLYEGFRTLGFLNLHDVKNSARFGPTLFDLSIQYLIQRVNFDMLALTQPVVVIRPANSRWIQTEIATSYLGMHYSGNNVDAVNQIDLYNHLISNRTSTTIVAKLNSLRTKFQVNLWHEAFVNNHVNNPINLSAVQLNIQNLANQFTELQNQMQVLQHQLEGFPHGQQQ
jgi:hypothetical protein